jgi:heavy metal translocating P-type ATPase
MVKLLRRYWFLLLALASSVTGFGLNFNSPELAKIAWSFGAALGLILSVRWLISAIKEKALGSDVLAVLAIIATGLTNEWFAASLISLMLASGRALELWAQGKASRHLDELMKRAPAFAHVVSNTGEVTDIAISEVVVKTRVLVRSGEVVPIDGLLEEAGLFDESALTGESLPVWREANTSVSSGVVNSGKPVVIIATATAATSTYANLIQLVASAKDQASKGVRLANVWAGRFVPLALLIALGTYLITQDIKQAVAVLVAATPCPLILAVPVALVAGISRAAQVGVIIKEGSAIEQLAQVEVVLLDKTGTLTEGGPRITNQVFAEGSDPKQVLTLAASLEQTSANIVARAMVAEAKLLNLQLSLATEVTEIHGHGLSGIVSGHKVKVGQPSIPLEPWANLTNALLVEIVIDGKVVGYLGLDDPLREESLETVNHLKALGVKRVLMVSGDRKETVENIANQLGVTEFFAECSPTQKLGILKTEKEAAKGTVLVVGDGINDAPALAAADVGIAMGAKGTTAASQAASVVIVEDSIRRIANAIDISQSARTRALQASTIGMSLAIVAMLSAALGYLNPSQAALVQELIDAASITWALVGRKPKV